MYLVDYYQEFSLSDFVKLNSPLIENKSNEPYRFNRLASLEIPKKFLYVIELLVNYKV